jgi:hypothetical protein
VEKVSTRLPSAMMALLNQCIARGLYGDQAMTVRHFITIGLEHLPASSAEGHSRHGSLLLRLSQ